MKREADHALELRHLRSLVGVPSRFALEFQVDVEDYASEHTGQIQDVILQVAGKSMVVRPDDVRLHLEESGEWERLGRFWTDLLELPTGITYAATYDEIRRRARGRRMRDGLGKIQAQLSRGQIQDATDSLRQLANAAEAEDAPDDHGEATTGDICAAATRHYLLEQGESPISIPKLGDVMAHLAPGALVTIGGTTGAGKSSLMLFIADAMVRADIRPGIISLEDPASTWGERVIARQAGVSMAAIAREGRTPRHDEARAVSDATETLRDYPASWVMMPEYDYRAVRRKMRRLVNHHGCGAIFVDYLQLLQAKDLPGAKRAEMLSYCAAELKLEAKRLGVPLVMASQLRRPDERRRHKRPTIFDLKETGDLENMSEAVVLLWKTSDDDRAAALGLVAKLKSSPNRPEFILIRNPAGAVTDLQDAPQPEDFDDRASTYRKGAR